MLLKSKCLSSRCPTRTAFSLLCSAARRPPSRPRDRSPAASRPACCSVVCLATTSRAPPPPPPGWPRSHTMEPQPRSCAVRRRPQRATASARTLVVEASAAWPSGDPQQNTSLSSAEFRDGESAAELSAERFAERHTVFRLEKSNWTTSYHTTLPFNAHLRRSPDSDVPPPLLTTCGSGGLAAVRSPVFSVLLLFLD
ncbi:uncharacterized protein LOC113202765 isoform X3 [Frankliniella occidentalis]|uniref:Uncharacterized protein LOC113202765 isoform X3 n=1 Tax=Frankliniella occidentalis TaxID=133901 RepID=A0A6J1RVS8_FRAOC|nr:uncharacterized protein LOC113202765 isoform X3 [Frankliniella occidentalis]